MDNTSQLLERLNSQEGGQVNLLKVAQELMGEFGGAAGLAREAKITYDDAEGGSQNKIRLLCAILELVGKAHPMQEQADPMAGLEQGELRSAILHLMQNEAQAIQPNGSA